ncbi:thioesterase family protein [Sagittula salina]|uniref:Thioesterase family protein n=1 Tax=Sagittula salina TaxID=2820268 RepID=A0A940S2B5_9RHOB|nr:thioesterase family protein [Sagittula salina]MBP0483917.1 thioesterase family protein [Sagittula salina]
MIPKAEAVLHPVWTGAVAAPLVLVEDAVHPEWVDGFGQMTMAYHLTVCELANRAFFDWVNDPCAVAAREGHEFVVTESHMISGGALLEGEAFCIETQVLAWNARGAILFHRVLDATGAVAATAEMGLLGFDLRTRRPEGWRAVVAERLAMVADRHARLERPAVAGRGIVLARD